MVRTFDVGRETLKLAAIVTMTVDHIGAILYPDIPFLRIIGRFAFPLFAYLVMLGIENTKKPARYILSLFVFALVSQIPYTFAFKMQPFEQLNILFPLCLSASALYLLNKKSMQTFLLVLPLALVLSIVLNLEGGFYAILTVCCMKLLSIKPLFGILSLAAVNLSVLSDQTLSLLAVPLILLHERGLLRREIFISEDSKYYLLRKYAFYVYYPLHLGLLYLINLYWL